MGMHILNALMILAELSVNSLEVHFAFGAFALIPAMLYMVWSWLYFDLSGKWDYFFMDPSREIDAVWMSLVFAMHLAMWSFVWWLARPKQRWIKRKLRNTQTSAIHQLLTVND